MGVGAATPGDHEGGPWSIMLLSKEEDQHKGCGGESARSRAPVGARGAVAVPAGVLRLVDRPGGRAVRADRRGAVRRRTGAVAGRAEPAGRAPARARGDV